SSMSQPSCWRLSFSIISFIFLGFPSAFLLFLLRKPKLRTEAKASGRQLSLPKSRIERTHDGAPPRIGCATIYACIVQERRFSAKDRRPRTNIVWLNAPPRTE